jgi:hypothetical protein
MPAIPEPNCDGTEVSNVRTAPVVGVLVLLLLGCGGFKLPRPGRVAQPEVDRVVKSTDGKSQLRIPAGWASHPELENDDATLKVAHLKDDAYCIVLTEPKLDFEDGTTCQDYAKLVLKLADEASKNLKVVAGPSEVMIGGRPALLYETQGTVKDTTVRCTHLRAFVDGEHSFHQIFAWTTRSRFEGQRKTLEDIVNSFEEVK